MSKDLIIRKNASEYTRINGVTKVRFETQSGGNADFIPEDEVPSPSLQSKTVTENGVVTADSGYDGLSSVTVSVPTTPSPDPTPTPLSMPSRYVVFTNSQEPLLMPIGDSRYAMGAFEQEYHDTYNDYSGIDLNDFDFSYLEELELKIEEVGNSVINGLTRLRRLKLHSTISIGNNAFTNCERLSQVYLYTSEIVSFGHNAFDGSPSAYADYELHFYVPSALLTTYQAQVTAFPSSAFIGM